jgi:hypothetical protein
VVLFVLVLYNIWEWTEPSVASVCISLGVEISPSTETVDFRSDTKELISLIKLVENFNLIKLISPFPSERKCIKGSFDIQEYRRRRHVIVEI